MKRAVLVAVVFFFLSAVPIYADYQKGDLVFLDKEMKEISSLSVEHIEVKDLNRYSKILDKGKISFGIWVRDWEPTFYVGSVPSNAKYVRWDTLHNTITWVIVRGIQTDLNIKMYVPAKEEYGLVETQSCSLHMWCLASEYDW